MATLLYLSVVSNWDFPRLWSATVNPERWPALFRGSHTLIRSLGLSVFISSFLSVVATAGGFALSKSLILHQRRPALVKFAFYPYAIAPVILGSMLQFYFIRWNLTGSVAGVMLGQLLFILPYSVILFSTFWSEKVRQTAFQASTLGASWRQINFKILLPMARPWLLFSLVQCFLISWFEYGITQLLGLGKVDTLTIQTMQFVKEADPHQAALAGCLMITPILVTVLVNRKLLTRRMRAI